MNIKDFFELTGRVRAAQKLYYKTRLNGDLVAAKGLESRLDKVLKDGLDQFEPTVTTMPAPEEQVDMFIEEKYDEQNK